MPKTNTCCTYYPPNVDASDYCRYYDNVRCQADATVALCAPDGMPVPGTRLCLPHAQIIHDDYRQKLNEDWPIIELLGRE